MSKYDGPTRRSRLRAHTEEDGGYVALLAVICMPIFMVLLGFVMDAAHWRMVGQREQKAADAAALAGAAYLPGDLTTARTIAQDIAQRNVLPKNATVTVAQGDRASQIKVTVSAPAVNSLYGLLGGGPTTTVTRSAVAEYQGPLAMGSPCNIFGDEPPIQLSTDKLFRSSKCSSSNGGFWANVAGPQSVKSNGDALQATICSTGIDGCTGTTNNDYSAPGYTYTIHVAAALTEMQVQVFDPAFVAVGDHCSDNLAGIPIPKLGANIYVSGDSSYCTGDQLYSGAAGDGNAVTTSFVVRAPSGNSADPTGGDPIAGCTQQFQGYNGSLLTKITSQLYPFSVFRKWVTLCDIHNVVAGDYAVQVRTDVPYGLDAATQPGTPGMQGGGHNRFSLRAGMPANDTVNSQISIHGSTAMSIYANVPGVKTQFFIARIPAGSGGDVLTLQLFDIGDASANGTITVIPPPLSGVTLSNCLGSGPVAGTLATCSLTATSAFNGKWEVLNVPIPVGYKCVDTDQTDCWFRIQYNYGTGTQVQDTTTWMAGVDGDPVRLLK